jgi:hypothetical protein
MDFYQFLILHGEIIMEDIGGSIQLSTDELPRTKYFIRISFEFYESPKSCYFIKKEA